MAIGYIVDNGALTQEQYRQIMDVVAPENRPAPGLIFHATGLAGDELCVVEIWESEEAFRKVVEERYIPAFETLGITVQPKFFQIINMFQS